MQENEDSNSGEHGNGERRSGERVRDDQRSGEGSASALSRHKMLERKHGIQVSDKPNDDGQ